MARQRTGAREFARLLSVARQPIYVLDDEQTLVFCNRACLDWVACEPEELLGRRCAYHSSPEVTGGDAVAAGLCPPPAALAGRSMTGTVSYQAGDKRIHRRRAHFSPLGYRPEESVGILVVVATEDLPDVLPPEPNAADDSLDDSAHLHVRVRRFRAQAASRYRVERLVGESPAMHLARAQIELAVDSHASVLVFGPPGSGRQHVAAAIHYGRAAAAGGSLIPLDCSVLGTDLIHSTVTALEAKRPLGEQTPQSTLLLNEVDVLPPEAQAELARVFSRKSFPVRLVATARGPLRLLARQGAFHKHLAAGLSTIEIALPPLVERREDLPLLAQLFLEDLNSRSEKQLGGFSSEALDRLDAYDWPGNVDELIQMVSQAHAVAEGTEIVPGDLPTRLHLAADATAHPRRRETTIVLDTFLATIEKELIQRALAKAKGNKARAARLLGMTRPRLYRRLVQLGLAEGDESQESSP